MRLSVTALTYWKTEHTIEDNEDAFAVDTHRGIFAISDGVGETSFAHEWAPIITNQFIENPLVSDDPFGSGLSATTLSLPLLPPTKSSRK